MHAARQNETARRSIRNPAQDPGAESYAKHCAICHGDQREGILPGFPPLVGINHRMADDKIAELVHAGKGRMPGFPNLQDGELSALVHYLTAAEPSPQLPEAASKCTLRTLPKPASALFRQNCAFCHGRDAMGGETGPGPDGIEAGAVGQDR